MYHISSNNSRGTLDFQPFCALDFLKRLKIEPIIGG